MSHSNLDIGKTPGAIVDDAKKLIRTHRVYLGRNSAGVPITFGFDRKYVKAVHLVAIVERVDSRTEVACPAGLLHQHAGY